MIDGIPIALGYFAVSFTLGIKGGNIGLKWFQSALMSLTNLTSAGQAAALDIISEHGSFFEIALSTLIINLRYLLMSAALTIKLSPQERTSRRMIMGYGVTDEIFGISVARDYPLNPMYNIGAILVACPGWTLGTALGGIMGEILPAFIVDALSIALYAMFLAIIIPKAREDKVIAVLVILAMALSFIFSIVPFLSGISSGIKVIILTVALSAGAAFFFPVPEEEAK